MSVPTWIRDAQEISAVLGAVATAVIAGIGVAIAIRQGQIARQQAHTAKQKLRLDLFGLRYAVYEAGRDGIIGALNQRADQLFDKSTDALISQVEQARFLFDEATHTYMYGLQSDIIDMRHRSITMKEPSFGNNPIHQRYAEEIREMATRLNAALTVLVTKVKPFLRVDEDLGVNTENVQPPQPEDTRATM